MIRFQHHTDLEFSANPQMSPIEVPVYVSMDGECIGYVIPVMRHYARRYRVHDLRDLCHADCFQLGETFDILRSFQHETDHQGD